MADSEEFRLKRLKHEERLSRVFDEVMGLGDFADSSRGSATSSKSGGQEETRGAFKASEQGERNQEEEEEDSSGSRQEDKMDEGTGESSYPRISSPTSDGHSLFTMGTSEGGGAGRSGGAAFDDALDGLEDDEDWHFALPMGSLEEDAHMGETNSKRSQPRVGNSETRGSPFSHQPREEEEEEQEREGSSGSANTSHSSQGNTPDNSQDGGALNQAEETEDSQQGERSEAAPVEDSNPQMSTPINIKDEPIDEGYDAALLPQSSIRQIKEELEHQEEELRISSVYSVGGGNAFASPNMPAAISAPPPATIFIQGRGAVLQAMAPLPVRPPVPVPTSLPALAPVPPRPPQPPVPGSVRCSGCSKVLLKGQTAFQRKGSTQLFCSTVCLTGHLPPANKNRSCCQCNRVLSGEEPPSSAQEGSPKPSAQEGSPKPSAKEGSPKPSAQEGSPKPSAQEGSPKPGRGRSQVRSWGQRERAAGDAVRSRSSHGPTEGWKTEADPDIVPQLPKFIPKRTPGVQPPLNIGNPSPGEIFSNYFDFEVLKLLSSNSNKNAVRNLQRGKKFAWTDVTPAEMKKYLGLLLYMAVMNLPKISDFWRRKTIFHVPFPATVMTRDRFFAISTNFHVSDPAEDSENEKKIGTEDYDCLHRVRPLLEMMRIRCMSLYHPKQHISVDERMVATKARLAFKQYMKEKPTKWGLKFFVAADVNGYTLDFKLYTGKSKFATGNGLSFDVVTSLINKDFLGSGYIIYCDNFYTSPLLFKHLGQQGFGACGTYRSGRVGVPSTDKNALTKKSPRGSLRWIREEGLLFVKWMDTREVSICSNIHTAYSGDTVLRTQKGEDGARQRVSVPRPTAVADYNRYMGGVDTSDQMIGTRSVHRKTRRWYVTVFQHFLDIAVTNSYIIHKEVCASQRLTHLSRQDFQEELCAHLLGVFRKSGPLLKHISEHFPVPTASGQEKAQRASMGRRQCALCKRCTPWQCKRCNVGLCLQLERNCFLHYHKGPKTPGNL